jgi:hypothetical protein
MKTLPNSLLALSAIVLAMWNWQIRQPKSSDAAPAGAVSALAEAASTASDNGKSKSNSSGAQTAATDTEPSQEAKSNRLAFNWASIEVSDYKEYVKRLRAIGFPEELVRDIIIADVDKMYESREHALKPKSVPYDAPLAQRSTLDISQEDWQHVRDLGALRVEKQTVLETILGDYVPREILRTPISRNYESYEYAINQLPPEKRDAVQAAQETEIYVEGYNRSTIKEHDAELEAFKQSRQQRDQALLQVLTPEEFERYEMNTTPAGTELARRAIGMQPTDEEFQTMFRIAYTNWLDTGGVYGRWRAMPVPREQIVAADQQMNESLKEALGPDRFLDYQMAVSGTGQQMRNFAARFELPRETMAQAFQLQTQIDRLGRTQARTTNPDGSTNSAGPPPQLADLQAQLQQMLGPELWQDWMLGKDLRVNLDP